MNELQNALSEMIESGSQANSALHTVIDDYAKYHAVLVIVGGLVVVIMAWLSVRFWAKFKRTSTIGEPAWSFEKKVYASFGIMSGLIALWMLLIVVANATNTFNPMHGFTLFVESFTASDGASYKDELRNVFNEWIKSGNASIPIEIQHKMTERIAFHTTKAAVSAGLLIVAVALGRYLWNAVIKRTKEMDSRWRLKEKVYMLLGVGTTACSLLFMLVVVANIQGASRPLTAFLVGLFG